MRKLEKDQSVMFCELMKVERKILLCSDKTHCDTIEVVDVLQWSISESCINTKKCIPLWATQEIRHQRHRIACSKSSNDRGKGAALEIAKSLLEAEAQTLQNRYEFEERRSKEQVLLHDVKEVALSKRETQVKVIRAKCREFELISLNNATLREEQERELSSENEQKRQVERSSALTPKNHSVHSDVKRFVHQEILDRCSDVFQAAFELFGNTSAIECLEKKTWSVHLLITVDFAQTIHASGNQLLNSFLRPVQWVASRKNRNTVDCVMLSPHEAQELLPYIRQHNIVTLHVYSPRVSMSVRTLEDLSFCVISAVLRCWAHSSFVMQLNFFVGQLYLRSYEKYLSICQFLELCFRSQYTQVQIACDEFISSTSRPEFDAVMKRECSFRVSSIEFLRMLMMLRRKGQNFQKSHIGRILHDESLVREHFQEWRSSSRIQIEIAQD